MQFAITENYSIRIYVRTTTAYASVKLFCQHPPHPGNPRNITFFSIAWPPGHHLRKLSMLAQPPGHHLFFIAKGAVFCIIMVNFLENTIKIGSLFNVLWNDFPTNPKVGEVVIKWILWIFWQILQSDPPPVQLGQVEYINFPQVEHRNMYLVKGKLVDLDVLCLCINILTTGNFNREINLLRTL